MAACCLQARVALQPRTVSAQTAAAVAIPADALVDSVGVNVHLHFRDTPYSDFPKVKSALLALGVRHLRDSLVNSADWPGYYDEHNELGALGIRSIFITSIGQSPKLWQSYPALMKQCFEGYENTNEHDNKGKPDWAIELKASVTSLSDAVRGKPGAFPVFGPSLVHETSFAQLGDLHQYFDYGNLHNYPGGHQPGNTGWGARNSQGHGYGGMAWQMDLLRTDAPGLPWVTTETGYTNQMSVRGNSVTESVAAIYLPRMILRQWSAGAKRTYLYELVSSLGEDFGLYRADWTPKPAFFAVSALLKLLSDPGPPIRTHSLDYSIESQDPDLRQMLFEKRDGSFYLAFWLEKSCFDLNAQQPIPVAPEAVRLRLPPGKHVQQYQWQNDGQVTTVRPSPAAPLPLSVSDRLTVLKIF